MSRKSKQTQKRKKETEKRDVVELTPIGGIVVGITEHMKRTHEGKVAPVPGIRTIASVVVRQCLKNARLDTHQASAQEAAVTIGVSE